MLASSVRSLLALKLAAVPIGAGFVLGLGSMAAARYQASEAKAPIDLAARPGVALTGSTVTLSGKTVVDGKRFTVTLTVTPPGGAPVKLTAKADSTGKYSVPYKVTKAGDYTIAAVAPDGKGTASAKFRVAGAAGFADSVAGSLTTLSQSSEETTQGLHTSLGGLPESPAKAKADEKLDALEKGEEALAKKADAAAKALARVAKVVEAYPDLAPAFAPYADELADAEEQADDLRDHGTEYLKKVQSDGLTCETLDFANEALSLLSMEMNLQGKIGKVILNLCTDKVFPGTVDAALPKASENSRFALSEAQKAGIAAAGGFAELRGSVFGLVGDTAQLISKKIFDAYCQKIEGPVTAKLDATFDGDAGAPYWKYTVQLTGKLSLRYPKSATKGTVEMKGQIEGNATAFTFWEDITKIEPFPKGGMVILRQKITPVPGKYLDPDSAVGNAVGRYARTATPAYFIIPVEGKLVKNKLTLTLDEALFDFPDDTVKNRLVLVFANPILPIPIIKKFDFPILKARFILNRGMSSDHPEFTLTTDSQSTHFSRDFTRKFDSANKDAHIAFTVKVEGSNPPAG